MLLGLCEPQPRCSTVKLLKICCNTRVSVSGKRLGGTGQGISSLKKLSGMGQASKKEGKKGTFLY